MANLQHLNGQTHEEVFAIGGLLRELSDRLQNLTSTFDEFTMQTACIAELATHVPIAMVELREATRYDNAMIGNISQQVTNLDTCIAQAHGDLLELHQCVERHTSYVEDGELCLALNMILARISHLTMADQIRDLDQRLPSAHEYLATPIPTTSYVGTTPANPSTRTG
jgi:hypothetical protein